MQTVLSGAQPSGRAHLGNYFGAIRQHIDMQAKYDCYYFLADLHALTTIKDAELMRSLSHDLAVTYLALGLDPQKTVFFKQSAVCEHAELCWIFDCMVKVPFLERAHAWKDAKEKGKKEITVGLFNYPILQAADILLYEPDLVPVGLDQKQHIEMTRDIAITFNQTFGGQALKLPEPYIKEEVAVVPGTDGQKMSKSYGNTIDIFADDSTLKKQVMGIVTDSKGVADAKDPATCNIFKLYQLFATSAEKKDLTEKYTSGGFGYGDAKKLLLNKILEHFEKQRVKYLELSSKKDYVHDVLAEGSKKAKIKASATLDKVKQKIGYL